MYKSNLAWSLCVVSFIYILGLCPIISVKRLLLDKGATVGNLQKILDLTKAISGKILFK